MTREEKDKFMQAMCNAANNHNAAAKERIEKEYGFIAGVDAMLWSIENYFHAEAEKMERSEEEKEDFVRNAIQHQMPRRGKANE